MLKIVKTDKYVIAFNPQTGVEIVSGTEGNLDPFILEFPNLMDIGVMGNCPNKCHFCYQGQKEQPNMKIEDYKTLMDEASNFVMQVALGGRGDPNLHENFNEIVEYTRSKNIIPNYTTSGRNLTDEQIEISKNCGAVAVSMYNLDYTFDSLKRLMDAGIKTNIHYMLTKKNLAEACQIMCGIDIWRGKVDLNRLNAIIFLLFKPQGSGKNLKEYILDDHDIETFSDALNISRSAFKLGMDSCMVNRLKKVNRIRKQDEMFVDTCEGARYSVYVSPDMKLVPCSFGNHDEDGVSLRGKNIKKVWDSERFDIFRKILEKDPAHCPFEL